MMRRMLKRQLGTFAVAFWLAGCASVGSSGSVPVPGATVGDKPVDQGLATRGASVWMSKACYTCHGFGRTLAGPDLLGIMDRRDHAWLRAWLMNTDSMIASDDPQVKAMLEQFKDVKMPDMKLQDGDIEPLFHYMAQETARVRGSGE